MLEDLVAEIERQDTVTEPMVDVDLFFDGNNDLGSIGRNLDPHPGLFRFRRTLMAIRDRPEVQRVLMNAEYAEDPDAWPVCNHVVVVTTASPGQVGRWAAVLRPDPPEVEAHPPWPVPAGHRVISLWWG